MFLFLTKVDELEDAFARHLFVHFHTAVETTHEQYFIHDGASIVAAIGGGLGLFLGFSCLTVMTKAIQFLLDDTTFTNLKKNDTCNERVQETQAHPVA